VVGTYACSTKSQPQLTKPTEQATSLIELDALVEDASPSHGYRCLLGHRRKPEAVGWSATLGLPAGAGHQHQLHQL
jgi:hypothetical protein